MFITVCLSSIRCPHLEVGTLHIWVVFLLLVVLSEVATVDRVVLALLEVIAGNQRSHFEITFFNALYPDWIHFIEYRVVRY